MLLSLHHIRDCVIFPQLVKVYVTSFIVESESADGVIDESGLLITRSSDDDVIADKSPSILQPSVEDPCTLTTPTFDSLPSFQVSCSHVECGDTDKVGYTLFFYKLYIRIG